MESAGKALIFIEDGSFTFDNRVKREVKTLEEAAFEVSVICPRYRGEKLAETVGRTHVYRYPKLSLGNGPVLRHISEYASSLFFGWLLAIWVALRRGFDVIQLCNPPDILFPIALFFKLFAKRYIFDHHDLCPELFETQFGKRSGFLYRVLCWAERCSLRWADGILSTNESYRRIAMERNGIPPGRIIVVRNGPGLKRFQDWQLPRKKQTVRVGYIGNMNPQDGVDYLLRAARHIRELGRKDVEFVLIGKGDSFPALRRLAADLALDASVRFTGRISDREAIRELSDCDMGCQPDPRNPLNEVSTMNKAMEYMALAKPVVAFDLAETRVSCAETALYAKGDTPEALAAEIIKLADDFELRHSMGLAGRRRVEEKLAWSHSEPPLLSMYRRVLGSSSAKRSTVRTGDYAEVKEEQSS